jgi:hypothetical protein
MLVYFYVRGEGPPEAEAFRDGGISLAEVEERIGSMVGLRNRSFEVVVSGTVINDKTRTLQQLGISEGDLVELVPGAEVKTRTNTDVPRATATPPDDGAPTRKADDGQKSASRGRRLDEYEEVTRLLQWTAPYHVDGSARPSYQVWSSENTALKSVDWNAYRTPDRLQYRTYVGRHASSDTSLDAAFDFALRTQALTKIDAARIDWLREVVPVLQYPEWGLCVIHQHVTRFALSSWIAGATEFQMFDEFGHAQVFGRLSIVLGEAHGGFDNGRELWMTKPSAQGLRRNVELILATLDWGEEMIAADVLLDPILNEAVGRMLTEHALEQRDPLTPFIWDNIAQDESRHTESALEFLRLLCEDSKYSEENRATIQALLNKWAPLTHRAVSEFVSDGRKFSWDQLESVHRLSDILSKWDMRLETVAGPHQRDTASQVPAAQVGGGT